MTNEFFITIIAIVAGPILAILAGRCLEKRAQKRERQMQVFRNLMATRQIIFSMENVGSLNLVEIEFHNDKNVMNAFKNLMALLFDSDKWERSGKNKELSEKISQDSDDLRAKLLNEMAKSLGYMMSDIEIMRGGYYPKLLNDLDLQRLRANEFIVDLAAGRKFIPIAVIDYTTVDRQKEATATVEKKLRDDV